MLKDFEKRTFKFNRIFPTYLSKNNKDLVFDTISKDILENVMEGINGTIIAYGQTGSGKTHTIVNEVLPSCAKYLW